MEVDNDDAEDVWEVGAAEEETNVLVVVGSDVYVGTDVFVCPVENPGIPWS